MADNVDITPGTGATIAADEISSVKYQRVKLAVGADGVNTGDAAGAALDGGSGVGLWTIPRPRTTQIQVASAGLTTSTTAYAANDQLGTIFTFANAVLASGGTGVIQSALLVDKLAIVGAADLYLFDRSVTLQSDNAPADFSDADMLFCQGVISFPTPLQSKASPSNAISQVHNLGIGFKPNVTSLFAALVTKGGHTFFGAAGDLVVTLTINQD